MKWGSTLDDNVKNTNDLELHVKVALEAVWSFSGGDWTKVLDLIKTELFVSVRSI